MNRSDDGSVTAFVVSMTVALVLCAGLVLDGGRLVAARSSVADVAENAARAGAQEVVSLRAGDWRLDPDRAAARARSYLSELGVSGSVSASRTEVRVTVERAVPMTLLALAGAGAKTVRVTRVAVAVDR
jgi:Flp pilus assembly protein TadG